MFSGHRGRAQIVLKFLIVLCSVLLNLIVSGVKELWRWWGLQTTEPGIFLLWHVDARRGIVGRRQLSTIAVGSRHELSFSAFLEQYE